MSYMSTQLQGIEHTLGNTLHFDHDENFPLRIWLPQGDMGLIAHAEGVRITRVDRRVSQCAGIHVE